MKNLFFLVTLLNSLFMEAKNLSAQEIRNSLEVRGDIYIVSSSGEQIVSGPERTNYWRSNPDTGMIESDWSSKFNEGLIALRQKWVIQNDGSIQASIEEYSSNSDNRESPVFKGLIEKKEFKIKNMEPIVWKVKNIKGGEQYIVRYIPSLREVSTPISLDSLPIAGSGIVISDNLGFLWAEDVQLNGKYAGVISHRGTLVMSYTPFNGGKEMGYAEGNRITLSVDKKFQINLKGVSSFLPTGVTAKVYAFYNPDKKTKGFNSLNTFDSNKEERISEVMKK